MPEFTPKNFTPEQTAAYVNGTCVVALSELMALHWANEICKAEGRPLLHGPEDFIRVAERHCVNHLDVLSYFEHVHDRQPKP